MRANDSAVERMDLLLYLETWPVAGRYSLMRMLVHERWLSFVSRYDPVPSPDREAT